MTNNEIITYEAAQKGFTYDGSNLYTYQQWKSRGKKVKKGEKAFIKTALWKYVDKKSKDKNDEEKKRGCYMVTANLFTADQVEDIKEDKK